MAEHDRSQGRFGGLGFLSCGGYCGKLNAVPSKLGIANLQCWIARLAWWSQHFLKLVRRKKMKLAARCTGALLFVWVTSQKVPALAQGPDADYMRPRVVALSVEFNDGNGDWKPAPKGLGTGFLIHQDGYVLSAKHLAPADWIGDETQWSKLRVRGRIGDLSLIHISEPTRPY